MNDREPYAHLVRALRAANSRRLRQRLLWSRFSYLRDAFDQAVAEGTAPASTEDLIDAVRRRWYSINPAVVSLAVRRPDLTDRPDNGPLVLP